MPFDRDHVVVLCRGSAKWNAWRAENPTSTPNLVGLAIKPSERVLNAASNPPLNLKAARLHRAVLRFSALSGVDFENAELFGVDLAHSKLDHAHLNNADISVASLDHADLTAANLAGSNLSGSRLRYARLSSARLASANMSLTDLTHAKFDRADLSGANLSNALLNYADFAGATLHGANLKGANLYHAKNLTPAQLNESIGADSTILPPHLQTAVRWAGRAKSIRRSAPVWHDQTALSFQRPHVEFYQNVCIVFVAALAAAGLLLSAYSLLPTREYASHATGQRQAQNTKFTVVASASASKKLLAERGFTAHSVEARFDIANPDLRVALAAATARQASQATAVHSVDIKSHPVFSSLSFDRDAKRHAASVLDFSKMRDHGDLARHRDHFEHPNLSTIETLLDHALRTRKLSILYADWRNVKAEAHFDLGDVDTREHAPPHAVELADDTAASKHAFDRIEHTREIVWVPEADDRKTAQGIATPSLVHTSNALGGIYHEPLVLVVSLHDQRLDAYRGASLIQSSKISSGKAGYDTRTGVFSILEKKRFHHSNLYSNAPMPWMQRLTRSGTALHAGIVPGYPASHGCIRLPFSFATKLFEMTEVGGNVVIAKGKVTPVPIEHPRLFQLADSRDIPLTPEAATNLIDLAQNESSVSITDTGHAIDALPPTDSHAVDPLAFADTDTNGAEAIKHALYRDDNGALRILVTKQTERDRIIAIQNMLASMGYLEHQRFTGKLGEATIAAIRAFQKANGMRETGTFNNEFAKRVYAIAGEQEPPPGRIFVRQDFRRVFEAPVQILDSDNALGTHVFIATRGNANKLQWFALSVEGDDSAAALDRIAIPSTIRDAIERKLRPGSSLIIGDMAVDSAILPEGDDFLVLTNSSPGEVKVALPKPSVSASKVAKIKKVTQSAPKRRTKKIPTISTQRIYHHPWRSYGGGLFSRW